MKKQLSISWIYPLNSMFVLTQWQPNTANTPHIPVNFPDLSQLSFLLRMSAW
jgi:hypothetical protein